MSDSLGVLDRSYPKQLGQSRDGVAQDCGIAIDYAFEAVIEAFNDAWPGFQDVLTELVGCSNNGSKRLVVDKLVVLAGPEEGVDGVATLVFCPLFQCLHNGRLATTRCTVDEHDLRRQRVVFCYTIKRNLQGPELFISSVDLG